MFTETAKQFDVPHYGVANYEVDICYFLDCHFLYFIDHNVPVMLSPLVRQQPGLNSNFRIISRFLLANLLVLIFDLSEANITKNGVVKNVLNRQLKSEILVSLSLNILQDQV